MPVLGARDWQLTGKREARPASISSCLLVTFQATAGTCSGLLLQNLPSRAAPFTAASGGCVGRGDIQPSSCPGSCWKLLSPARPGSASDTQQQSVPHSCHCSPGQSLWDGDGHGEEHPDGAGDSLGHPPTSVPSSDATPGVPCDRRVPRRWLQGQEQPARLPRRNFAWHAIF